MITRPSTDFEMVDFGDKRLNRRLLKTIENLTKKSQASILGAEGDRSGAKSFYRLLSNKKFDIRQLTDSVRDSTISRMSVTDTVLLIEDSTDINLKGHKETEGLGYSSEHVRGIKTHSCIAITAEGLPLGVVGQYYETRPESKSSLTAAEKSSRPIEEKESYRWLKMLEESTDHIPTDVRLVTICDREGDFYELYAKAQELGEDFIIRVSHDRVTESNGKLLAQIRRTSSSSQVTVNIPRNSRSKTPARQVEMEISYCTVRIKKPKTVTDLSLPEALTMNFVRIWEAAGADAQEGIEWTLVTSLPINSPEEALVIVEYYVQRWKIERFHFVLKSGCSVEKIQQRTYEKIKPMLLIYSVIAMYIMAVTYIGRILPDTSCDVFFDTDEWQILYRIIHKTKIPPSEPYSMSDAIRYLGHLGSYRRAPSNGPPGVKSIWQGLIKLYDFIALSSGLL